MCVCVCLSVTAVSRQPLVRSDWNLPDILLGTWVCAFSRFDINRTSGSQVMAIYLPNQWQDTLLRRRGRWGNGALVTNDRTRCLAFCTHSIYLLSIIPAISVCLAFKRFEINWTSGSQVMAKLERVPHYGLQRTDFRIVMTYCILIISRFLMRIYR